MGEYDLPSLSLTSISADRKKLLLVGGPFVDVMVIELERPAY